MRGQSSTYGVAATWGDGKGAPVRGCRFGGAPKIGPPTSVPGPEQYRFGAFDSERVHADATRLETTRLRQLRALCQWALQLPHPVVIAIARLRWCLPLHHVADHRGDGLEEDDDVAP